MNTLLQRKWLVALILALVIILGSLYLVIGGPWAPTNRARAHTLEVTQEIYKNSPFDILDQVSEARVNQDGCSTYQTTFRIGSSLALAESIPAFKDSVQKNGWTLLPDNYADIIFYFHRADGEALVIYTENIGPREWLQPPVKGTYTAFLYVVVASGFNYFGPCKNF